MRVEGAATSAHTFDRLRDIAVMNLRSILLPALICALVPIAGQAGDLSTTRAGLSPVGVVLPTAAGGRRILLVDDDVADNPLESGDKRLSPSDVVDRRLVAEAVGGDAAASDVEVVRSNASGPSLERPPSSSTIIRYAGASYGGSPDSTAAPSVEDEKSVRRYLEAIGGAAVPISPAYLGRVLDAGSADGRADGPFLTRVIDVLGGVGLAKRFEAGMVKTGGGAQFEVGKGSGAAETEGSSITPEGASALLTKSLAPTEGPDAVISRSNAYGRGSFIYAGSAAENLAEPSLRPAIQTLFAAATPASRPTEALLRPNVPLLRRAPLAAPVPLKFEASGSAAWTRLQWTLPSAPTTPNSSTTQSQPPTPNSGLTVKLERWTRNPLWGGGFYWTVIPVEPGATQVVDRLAEPGTSQRYRLTVTDATGANGSKELTYNVPPALDPAGFSARLENDGTAFLSWAAVPGVSRYQIESRVPISPNRPGVSLTTYVVSGATEWRSPPLDNRTRTWRVTSLYQNLNGEYVTLTPPENWPSARTELNPEHVLTKMDIGLMTGDDNKERLSRYEIRLYINGAAPIPAAIRKISSSMVRSSVARMTSSRFVLEPC
jgi:hypothetical protein